jgi:hypothetical protein
VRCDDEASRAQRVSPIGWRTLLAAVALLSATTIGTRVAKEMRRFVALLAHGEQCGIIASAGVDVAVDGLGA